MPWWVFCAGTVALAWVSRAALARPQSHGFYRFFAFEAILALVVLNFPVWTQDPCRPLQLLSWTLLAVSIGLVLHALRLLLRHGQPTAQRTEPELFAFERTSALVTSGVFAHIRHPMYTSLLLLAWGAFLKAPSWFELGLATLASVCLWLTALRDEAECRAHFGEAYVRYMARTKRFVPWLL